MNNVRLWNNHECEMTKGKSGSDFSDILYWSKAGDIVIDAEGKYFQCTHAQLQNGTNYNWYVCLNELTKEDKIETSLDILETHWSIDTTKESVAFARYTNDNNWTKYLTPNWYEDVPLYPFDV